jgi:hypothetical protein
LNDAPNVRIFNNTIMKNITTATALTSNGFPAPAGLSTSLNSDMLQATLPGGSPLWSNPLLFNNIFWDNRAGTRSLGTVSGIGNGGPGDIYNWDLGVAAPTSPSQLLSPTDSILQVDTGTIPDASNLALDPTVLIPYDVSVSFLPWRGNPRFTGAIMVAADLPSDLTSNYHLLSGSPAIDIGADSKNGVLAPRFDIDLEVRPFGLFIDSGADEVVTAP